MDMKMKLKILVMSLLMFSGLKVNAQMDDFIQLVTAATQAPSGHNSQPWLFEIGTNEITILPNFSRELPAVDPSHREFFMSLGCALENLCIKASSLGYATQVNISPEGVIRVGLQKSEAVRADLLSEYITKRQTNRSVYDGKIIPDAVLKNLLKDFNSDKVSIQIFDKNTEVFGQLTGAVMQGNTIQMNDPAFKSELLSWIRFNTKHSESTNDGISYAALGAPNLPRWITEPIVKMSLKGKKQNKTDLKKINSSSNIVLITSAADDIHSWIDAGRTLQRFLLTLTKENIAHAYINQPCEVPEVRNQLREKIAVNHQFPQILLRIGYAKPLPYSKRKPIQEVIRNK